MRARTGEEDELAPAAAEDLTASSRGAQSPRAVLRVVKLLECVADHPEGCTLAFLTQQTGAPKSSLLNLLRGLVGGGFLELVNGVYVLGPESYGLAVKIGASLRLPELTHASLQHLSDASNETALLGVPTSDRQIAYVDKVEPSRTIRATVVLGERRPLYSSAGGRAILAFLPAEKIDGYLKEVKLQKATSLTETRRSRILQILSEVRRDGFASTVGEAEIGLSGVAAPIFDGQGAVVASLILSGPSERFDPQAWCEPVRRAAVELSRLRGFAGWPPET